MFCHHIYECVTYNLWHFWKVKKSSQDVEQNKEQNLSCNAVHRVKSLLTFLLIDFNKTWKKTPALVFCWQIQDKNKLGGNRRLVSCKQSGNWQRTTIDSISEDVPSSKSLRCPSCPCAGHGECDQVSDNCKRSPNLEEDVIAGFLQVDLGLGLAIIGWEEAEEYFGIILTLLPQFFRSLSPISLHRTLIAVCRQS